MIRGAISSPPSRAAIARGMAKAAAPKPKKAMPRPPPPRFRKVCRYVFPYPKCIDLMSLRPEPYCIETGGPCRAGSNFLLLAGLLLTAVSAYFSATTAVHSVWYNFEEDDCCVEDDE